LLVGVGVVVVVVVTIHMSVDVEAAADNCCCRGVAVVVVATRVQHNSKACTHLILSWLVAVYAGALVSLSFGERRAWTRNTCATPVS